MAEDLKKQGVIDKVDAFVDPGITNYDENKYRLLKEEVQNMPGLDPSSKNSSKFYAIRNALTTKLEDFNAAYYSAGN